MKLILLATFGGKVRKGAESGTQSHTPCFLSSYFLTYVCIYVYIFEAASLNVAQAVLELPV